MSHDAVGLASSLAQRLPAEDLHTLATAAGGGRQGLLALRANTSANVVRSACDQLLAALLVCSPDYLAGALAGAVRTVGALKHRQSIDVVWTGPTSDITTSRLTSAVVVDLLDAAREEILLVSYAAHTEPAVAAALRRAVDRGVEVTLLLERHMDNPGYTYTGAAFPGLAARRLAWPAARRPAGAALHAKVIVIDGSVALVGSANITGRAMESNLECGVLLRGGDQPAQIRRHVLGLVEAGELEVCDP